MTDLSYFVPFTESLKTMAVRNNRFQPTDVLTVPAAIDFEIGVLIELPNRTFQIGIKNVPKSILATR
jgi:hypothetical protein